MTQVEKVRPSKTFLTFVSFITTAIDALRTLSTLLSIPSASKKGKTISIALCASDISVRETSQSLVVKEVTARHNFSPEILTVSFMSSITRNVPDHNLFKCFPTCGWCKMIQKHTYKNKYMLICSTAPDISKSTGAQVLVYH